MSFNKNPRIAVDKLQPSLKNDKEDSDSDIEFIDIKPNTEYRSRGDSKYKIAVNKSQLCLKNDKEDSDSDVEFIDIKPNTESRSRKRISSKDSKYRTHRSPSTSVCHSSRSNRRKSSTSSNTPSEITLRRSYTHSHSRSRSPYYNRHKYSSHPSRERDETYRKQIYTLSNVQPTHLMSDYIISGYSHPSMYYAGPTLYSPEEYHEQKKRNMSKSTRLVQEQEKAMKKMKVKMKKQLASYEKNHENNPLHQDEWDNFQSQYYKQLLMVEGNELLGDINMDKSSSELPSIDSPSNDKKSIIGSKHSPHNIPVSEVLVRDSDIVVNKLYNDTKPRVNCVSPINSDSQGLINKFNDHNKSNEKIEIENPLNVMTVLRQLSVLESQFGLLAPIILDLFSKSILMEKNEPKSSIRLLTPANCAIFETAKEKLKGQLFANVLKMRFVNVAKSSICNIDKLLQFAPKFSLSMLNSTPTSISMPIVLPGLDIIDHKTIAQQITKVLLEKRIADFSQNNFETNAIMNKVQSGDDAKNLVANINNGGVIRTTYEKVDEKEEIELTHNDIIHLLQNFKTLEPCEQNAFIIYLQNLAVKKPDEVKKFRKFINLAPFNLNEDNSVKVDEDDDNSYDLVEVCKAINKTFKETTEEQKELSNSIKNVLPAIKSDYSLEPSPQYPPNE